MEAYDLDNYTYEDYLQIDKTTPDEERYELIFGHIFMMSGASREHQDIVGSIFFTLKQLQKESGCSPVIAPFDLKIECKGVSNVVQPDVLLYCEDELRPCAIFEVLSPSTAYKDKGVKKELYESCAILEYFLVDPLAKTVEKFILQDNRYMYDRCYGEDDKIHISCLKSEFSIEELLQQ